MAAIIKKLVLFTIVVLVFVVKSIIAVDINLFITENDPARTLNVRILDHSEYKNKSEETLNKLTYEIRDLDEYFKDTLSITNGFLINTEPIERDTHCAHSSICDIIFKLRLVVSDEGLFEIIPVNISVLDMNDEIPTFDESVTELTISESSPVGFNLPLPIAKDDDSPAFSIQSYQLESQSEIFELVTETNSDGSLKPSLQLMQTLDYESTKVYTFILNAYDGGTSPQSGSTQIRITVKDVNDNRPEFVSDKYNIEVKENEIIPSIILTVSADDSDSGNFGTVIYSFDKNTEDEFGDTFSVNAQTGEISVNADLDYETVKQYVLIVQAGNIGDNTVSTQSASTTVTVKVTDVNDNGPVIKIIPIEGSPVVQIKENLDSGAIAAEISVTDPDTGTGGEFSCSLASTVFMLEKYDDNNYILKSKATFDREDIDSYTVTVICADKGLPVLTSTVEQTVVIADENDNVPKFTDEIYKSSILENNLSGNSLTRVLASDADIGENARVTYSILENQIDFTIGEQDGIVRAARPFDFESERKLTCRVVAMDHGDPQLSAIAEVEVTIVDQNDEPPQFDDEEYNFAVHENIAPDTLVGTVTAHDLDTDNFNTIKYSIDPESNSGSVFYINEDTGSVYSNRSLDRESKPIYQLKVIARGLEMNPLTGSTSVVVYVTDINDNSPVIEYPTKDNSTLNIDHAGENGELFHIVAYDADSGQNSQLLYSMVPKDLSQVNIFSVDVLTGLVTLNNNTTNIVHNKVYTYLISVSDNGEPLRRTNLTVDIILGSEVAIAYPVKSAGWSSNVTILVGIGVGCGFVAIILIILIVYVALTQYGRKEVNTSQNNDVSRIYDPQKTISLMDENDGYYAGRQGVGSMSYPSITYNGNKLTKKDPNRLSASFQVQQTSLDNSTDSNTTNNRRHNSLTLNSQDVEPTYSVVNKSRPNSTVSAPHRQAPRPPSSPVKHDNNDEIDSACSGDSGANTDSGHGSNEEVGSEPGSPRWGTNAPAIPPRSYRSPKIPNHSLPGIDEMDSPEQENNDYMPEDNEYLPAIPPRPQRQYLQPYPTQDDWYNNPSSSYLPPIGEASEEDLRKCNDNLHSPFKLHVEDYSPNDSGGYCNHGYVLDGTNGRRDHSISAGYASQSSDDDVFPAKDKYVTFHPKSPGQKRVKHVSQV